MQILALNGSPNRDKGNTHLVLQPFLAGAVEAGAPVETVYVSDLKVEPCKGCYGCWFGGEDCVIGDDMADLLPRIGACDVFVLAAPLYVDLISGPTKNVLDRFIPMIAPTIELREGHCRHPKRPAFPGPKSIALVSVCGFWEIDNFYPLVGWFEAMGRNMNAPVAGTILRPHAYTLAHMPDEAPPKQKVLEALHRAGAELVRNGKVSAETEDVIAHPLMSRDEFLKAVAG